MDGQFLQAKRIYFVNLEIKEQLFVEHLTMSLHRLSWVMNMMKWLTSGVLECFVINYALDMLHFNHPRVDKRHIIRF